MASKLMVTGESQDLVLPPIARTICTEMEGILNRWDRLPQHRAVSRGLSGRGPSHLPAEDRPRWRKSPS